jgi:sulfide:quinone oxidoreductase
MFGPRAARPPTASAPHVVIAGGGVGALETAFALRALTGDELALTLVTPASEFVYRPVAVLEPFVNLPARRVPLARVASELQATLVHERVIGVDAQRHTVATSGGHELTYDHGVIAVGARLQAVAAGTTAIAVAHPQASLAPVLEAIDRAPAFRVGFQLMTPTWPLPAYELALLTRRHARDRGRAPAIVLITNEARPLAMLGTQVSETVARLLAESDIEVRHITDATGFEQAAGDLDVVLALPTLRGPEIPGLPLDTEGFLPVSGYGQVADLGGLYGVGDATGFPLKFGGVAALQADAVASTIAAAIGALAAPQQVGGLVEGVLLTGGEPGLLHLTLTIGAAGVAEGRISAVGDGGRWSDEAKISARYLGAYLDQLWADGPAWRVAAGAA